MLRPDELCKVAPGNLADLILVDGDPLADITILQDHDKIQVIMKDGRFHKRTPRRTTHRRRSPRAPARHGRRRGTPPPLTPARTTCSTPLLAARWLAGW